MYAVIKTGGKQHKVTEGDVLEIEKVAGSPGDEVIFDQIVLLSDSGKLTVNTNILSKVKVFGTIVEQSKADKIIVFKYKPKKGYHKKKGHRQRLTRIQIDEISISGTKTKKAPAKKKAAEAPVNEKGKETKKKPTAKAKAPSKTKAVKKEAAVKAKKAVKTPVKKEATKKEKKPTESKPKVKKEAALLKPKGPAAKKAKTTKPAAKKRPAK